MDYLKNLISSLIAAYMPEAASSLKEVGATKTMASLALVEDPSPQNGPGMD